MKIRPWICVFIISLQWHPAWAKARDHAPKKESRNMALINTRLYGEACNSAYLPFTTSIKGHTVWSESSKTSSETHGPRMLAIKDDLLLIVYGSGYLECRDRKSGKLMWNRETSGKASFHLTNDGALVMVPGSIFAFVDSVGKIDEKTRLPFAGDGYLWTLDQAGKEYRYCYLRPPQLTNSPSDATNGPVWSYIRYAPESDELFLWELIRKGFIKDAFFNSDKSLLCVISDTTVNIIKTTGSVDADAPSISCSESFCGAYDKSGDLYVILTETIHDKQKPIIQSGLACYNSKLKRKWWYALPIQPHIAQPPAALDNESVLLLSDNTLNLISGGKQIWHIDLPCEWNRAAFSVLKDQSFLISAGVNLLHISLDGKEINRMLLGDLLSSRPIVDESGRVYVAGEGRIYCIE
jgi:hypothetical protein